MVMFISALTALAGSMCDRSSPTPLTSFRYAMISFSCMSAVSICYY